MKGKISILKAVSILLDTKTAPHTVHASTVNTLALYLTKEWSALAKPLLDKADSVKKTEASVEKFLKDIDASMGQFSSNVEKELEDYVSFFYKYSKNEFIKGNKLAEVEKADLPKVTPILWTDKDDNAIKQLNKMSKSSTGKFYKGSVQKAVHDSVRENMFETQLPLPDAVKQMKKDLSTALRLKSGKMIAKVVPGGFIGTAEEYFSGLAMHTASMARTSSSVYTMSDVGVKNMIVRSLKTNRTCAGCLEMDGTTYPVKDAMTHIDNILAVDSIDEIKKLQPSFHFDVPDAIKPGSAKDQALKELKDSKSEAVMLPTFHFRCECYVDMA